MTWYEWLATGGGAVAIGYLLKHLADTYLFVKKGNAAVATEAETANRKGTMEEQNEAIKQLLQVLEVTRATAAEELKRVRDGLTEEVVRLEAIVGRNERNMSRQRDACERRLTELAREKEAEIRKLREDAHTCFLKVARYEQMLQNHNIPLDKTGEHRPLPPGGTS